MDWKLYIILVLNILYVHVYSSSNDITQRNLFATDIYQAIANDHLPDNIVISPSSIQTSMALAYYGAKDRTAQEMKMGLRFPTSDPEQVAQQYGAYQQSFVDNNYVHLFNNIYINENLEFKAKFKEVAQRNFNSNIEKADFHPPYNKRTAERINRAVEQKTNNKITNIIEPQQLNDLVEGIIVNAISYSGTWQNAFKAEGTSRRSFREQSGKTVSIDTMSTVNQFKYGEFNNLDAKVIELPYQNSAYSMLILLPNSNNGLQNLIKSLEGKDINALVKNGLSLQKIELYLPKFNINFGLTLEEPFKKLGMNTMFTRDGNFGNLYRMFVSHYINSAIHKAQVEVKEAGIESPKEGGGLLGIFSRTKKLEVDHPFVFAIKHDESILFIGHISSSMFG